MGGGGDGMGGGGDGMGGGGNGMGDGGDGMGGGGDGGRGGARGGAFPVNTNGAKTLPTLPLTVNTAVSPSKVAPPPPSKRNETVSPPMLE